MGTDRIQIPEAILGIMYCLHESGYLSIEAIKLDIGSMSARAMREAREDLIELEQSCLGAGIDMKSAFDQFKEDIEQGLNPSTGESREAWGYGLPALVP